MQFPLSIFIVLSLCVVAVVLYNGFVSKRNVVRESYSGIDVMLKKRFDLIPNLVDTVKVYMAHEKDTLSQIVTLRNDALGASTSKEMIQVDAKLAKKVRKVLVAVENYPALKSSDNFIHLQDELVAVETDIERSKRYYNGAVREYNTAIESFPGNFLAKLLGFVPEEFLTLAESYERFAPSIKID